MARFLHLSDLHLGTAAADDFPDDFKSDVVPYGERQSRRELLRNSFVELRQVLADPPLDAVVMTGDVTYRNEEQGFIDFEPMLNALGDLRPSNDRILVLPGNHDVTRRTAPSTPAHYEHYLQHVRGAGFVTPLLDGVGDFDEQGNVTSEREHLIAAEDFSWIIIPINSANYSGALEPLPEAVPPELWDRLPELAADGDQEMRASIEAALGDLRLRDAIRVSGPQLLALRSLLQALDARIWQSGRDPADTVRIAAIHHQLLPVSTVEEFAQFEAITNLGLLRNFLRVNGFRVVLHGHKHTAFVYWDHIYPSAGASEIPHRVLVVSGATIGGGSWKRDELARLIELRESARAPALRVASIPAVEQGAGMATLASREFSLWRDGPAGVPGATMIQGRTGAEVYERVRSFFSGLPPTTIVPNVICQVADGQTALRLPDHYPEIPGVAEAQRQAWFDEMIEWWQRPSTKLGDRLYFTHGGRIYAYREAVRGEGQGIDQVRAVVNTLGRDPDSGRAVIALLDPEIDPPENDLRKFPAFALMQAAVRQAEDGRRLLDCVGYFRKHEMTYWWPVNLGEMAHVQKKILDELQVLQRGVVAGSLTTVSALAYAGDARPRVAVPLIDRIYDEAPEQLWDIVYGLFKEDSSERSETIREWTRYLDDMLPESQPDPDGVPIALDGVDYVRELISSLSRHHPNAPAAKLEELLSSLYDENIRYHQDTVAEGPTAERHREWADRVGPILEGVRNVLTDLEPAGEQSE